MSNTESVYAHTKLVAPRPFDPSAINSILTRNNPLDIDFSPDSRSITLMRLRYFLIAMIADRPESKFEFEELEDSVSRRLSEDLWNKEDREQIMNICRQEWKSRLLPRVTEEAFESLKCKLNGLLPTGILVDLGFSFVRCAGSSLPLEDFMLDHLDPLFKGAGIESAALRQAFKLISEEYQSVLGVAKL